MSRDRRRNLSLLALAISLGALGDSLFDGHPLGANAFLFALAFVGALALLLRIGGAATHQGRRWMAAPLLTFAAAFAWRDSAALVAANLLAVAGAVSLGALRRTQPRPQEATLAEYAAGLAAAGAGAFAGTVAFLEREVPWGQATRGLRGERAAAFGRGAAIGLPFVLVFGALFVTADAVFRHLATSAVPTVLIDPWPHVVVAAGVAWVAAGLLRDLVADREAERLVSADVLVGMRPVVRLGGTEVAVALAVLDLLFVAFVAVQARYLFGGRGVVLSHEHLTYAQYARNGFFELLAASALVVPVVVAANTVARERLRLVRSLSAALVVLELVVAASALQRLRVYVQQYGLTELRIYAAAVIVWIAAVLLWSLATVLRGRGRRFAVGAVLGGFVLTAALNIASPDALIARTNVQRPKADVAYLGRLGDDAVPTLLRELPLIRNREAQRRLAAMLLARRVGSDALGWNASRSAARRALESHRQELVLLAGR